MRKDSMLGDWSLDEKRGDVHLSKEELLRRGAALEGVKTIQSQYGWTRIVGLPSSGRTFVLHTPPLPPTTNEEGTKTRSTPLLVFFLDREVMQCGALSNKLVLSKRVSSSRFGELVVVFLQAEKDDKEKERERGKDSPLRGGEGDLFCGIDRRFEDLSFGEKYFEVLDSRPKFHEDIQYVREAVDFVTSRLCIDPRRRFLVGHSNGGVFALQVLLHLPRLFTAVCSHQGGIGMQASFYLDFDGFHERVKKEKRAIEVEEYTPAPLLIFTGEKDIHLDNCKQARAIFENAFVDYHPRLVVTWFQTLL